MNAQTAAEEAVALMVAGQSRHEIGARYEMNPRNVAVWIKHYTGKTITQHRQAHGVSLGRSELKAKPLGPEMVELYEAGMTMVEIADWFSVDRATVSRGLDSQGIPRRTIAESRAISRNRRAIELGLFGRVGSRTLDESTVAEMAELYAGGMSTVEIGAWFGVDDRAVCRYLDSQGIPRRTNMESTGIRRNRRALEAGLPDRAGSRPLDEAAVAEMVELYKGGMTTVEIGERFSVRAAIVRRTLKSQNIALSKPAPSHPTSTRALASEMAELYEGGMSVAEIADWFSVNRSTVRRTMAGWSERMRTRSEGEAIRRAREALDGNPVVMRPHSPWTRALASEMAELYEGGMTTVEIADWFSVNEATVRRNLDSLRVPGRTNQAARALYRHREALGRGLTLPPTSTRALASEMAELYEGGMTTVEIADWFSVNEATVRRNLDSLRVPRRTILESKEISRHRRALEVDPEVVALFEGGMSPREIADWFGIREWTVRRVLLLAQVPPRTVVEARLVRSHRDALGRGFNALATEMVELYKGGMSSVEIGDWFGVRPTSVRGYLEARCVPRRSIREAKVISRERRALVAPVPAADLSVRAAHAEIVELYEGGMSMTEIADWFRIGRTTVRRYLDRQGVERRPAATAADLSLRRAGLRSRFAESRRDAGPSGHRE